MPSKVLFVHGYSESSLGAYFQFPQILKGAEPEIDRVALAGFDSLDDAITIDDLSNAMEVRVGQLNEPGPWDVADSAVICHSTGALIARRWILNRVAAGKPIPSHLITVAGANHGSTLANMGKSVLGYVQKMVLKREWSVGQGVLTDLEYGSDFLRRLNREWLDAWNSGRLGSLFAFSMGGDSIGNDPTMKIFWQTHEPGSDNTVRISGANLNYAMIEVQHDENGTSKPTFIAPTRRVPHLILPGYSHFGADTGILGDVHGPDDPPMAAVRQALAVKDAASYELVEQDWRQRTSDWTVQNTGTANATAVFTLLDRNGSSISDCLIAFLDESTLGSVENATLLDGDAAQARAEAMASAKNAILGEPIQNDVQTGSYCFYVNYAAYVASSPHWFHVEFAPAKVMGRAQYVYKPILFTQPPDLPHTVAPNETTYLGLTIGRASNEAYAIWQWDEQLNLGATTYPPFDQSVEFLIAPPSEGGK